MLEEIYVISGMMFRLEAIHGDSGVGRGGLGGLGPPQSWQPDLLLGAKYCNVT